MSYFKEIQKALSGGATAAGLVFLAAQFAGLNLTEAEAGLIAALVGGVVGAVVWFVPNIHKPEALLLAAARIMGVELSDQAAAQLVGKFRRLLLEMSRDEKQ